MRTDSFLFTIHNTVAFSLYYQCTFETSILVCFFSIKSSSIVDITGSFTDSLDEDDNYGQIDQPEVYDEHESEKQELELPAAVEEGSHPSLSYQVLNGSVVLTPSKAFQSDSSESESDGNMTDEETGNFDDNDLNQTKYV